MTKIVILTEGDVETRSHDEPVISGMREYVKKNGKHFNHKLLSYATSLMRRRDSITGREKTIVPFTQADVDSILDRNGIHLENNEGLDYVFVANMAKADFWKSSIEDEKHLALYIKDVIDDIDTKDGTVFCRWTKSVPEDDIPWEELI